LSNLYKELILIHFANSSQSEIPSTSQLTAKFAHNLSSRRILNKTIQTPVFVAKGYQGKFQGFGSFMQLIGQCGRPFLRTRLVVLKKAAGFHQQLSSINFN